MGERLSLRAPQRRMPHRGVGRRASRVSLAFVLAVFFVGCDKSDPTESTSDPAATATASASTEADTQEPRDPLASARPTASASAGLASVRADAGPTPSEAPLYFFMQGRIAAPLREGDAVALAAALSELATFAPKDLAYANWAAIAKDGADAARSGSVEGTRAACRGCHSQYRNLYKTAMRARPLR